MRLFVFLISLCCLSSAVAQGVPSIAEIAVELEENQSLPLAEKISFELVAKNAEEIAAGLQKYENISIDHINANSLSIAMTAASHYAGSTGERYSEDSFVIDISEESTKQFVSGFQKEENQNWQLEDLVKYVSAYITDPTYIHGFNIASVVASQRSGDCTEFAVLTTALARSLNLPAKVKIGTVIIENEGEVLAFGHAWSEVWRNGQWHILDAALYDLEAVQHFYLPALALENEGPGYLLSLMQAVGQMPKEIKNLRDYKIKANES